MRKNFGAKTWIYPLPVLIIGTYDKNGVPNAMNVAWGGISDYNQVSLSLSPHKTTDNIEITKAFTVSIADASHVVEADFVGVVSANKIPNKLEVAGLHVIKSSFVNAPIIEEFPLTLECEYAGTTDDGRILGNIVNVSADERILTDGKIDPIKLQAISFDPVNNAYLVLGDKVGNAFKDGFKLNK